MRRSGMAALIVGTALLVAASLFRDILIGAALLVVIMVVGAEAAWVVAAVRRVRARVRLSWNDPETARKVILYPGDVSSKPATLAKELGGTIELSSRLSFQEVTPKTVRGTGRTEMTFRFSTEYAGEYSGDEVGATLTGPLGLFSSESVVPLPQRYVVYPRLLQVAETAVRFLGKAEVGETPAEMPGIGSEFYEMRAYQPGDDYRNVNWKATAHQGELIVVEHMKDVGSSYLLVLDARARGFREADALASTFMALANGLAFAGVGFGVLAHDGKKVVEAHIQQDPRGSLGAALRAAVSFTRLGANPDFLELVPIGLRSRLAGGTGEGWGSALSGLSDLRRSGVRARVEGLDPWATSSRYLREAHARSIVYVSGLFGEVQPLIELAWEARHYRDSEFMVANPCEADAAEGRSAASRTARAMAAAGIPYYRGSPARISERILSATPSP